MIRFRSVLTATLLATLSPMLAGAQEVPKNNAIEPASREGWWMKMHEAFLERAKKPVDVLFLGDSITQGWAGEDKDGHGPIEVWNRYYTPRNAANFGIGGDQTQHVLWRLDHGEVDSIKPKLAVLMIGTNNAGSNSAEQISEGITAIVKKLKEKLPETKILLLGVFPRSEKPDQFRAKLSAVNETIKSLDDGKTVHYLDISKSFLKDDGSISQDIMPDYLHLSRAGYRIWADAIEPKVWSLVEGN
ncbi:platelet-activating factor acetylhydrolase IB subunit [Isosphaeraceae bacterium EP7]